MDILTSLAKMAGGLFFAVTLWGGLMAAGLFVGSKAGNEFGALVVMIGMMIVGYYFS